MIEKKFVLGVDPGLSGALALLSTCRTIIEIHDIPTVKDKAGKRHVNMPALAMIFTKIESKIEFALVEDVGAMPNQGLSSTFKFGEIKGVLIGMLSAHYIPQLYIRPAVWKMAMGLSRDKQLSIDLATKLYPNHKHLWPLKKNNDRCEALLLAHFGLKSRNALTK